MPAQQTSVPGHASPKLQLGARVQAPLWQESPVGQTLPQLPQLLGDRKSVV